LCAIAESPARAGAPGETLQVLRRIPGSSSPETWVATMGRTVAGVDGDRACDGIIDVSSDLHSHVESDTQYVKGEVREVPEADPGKEEAIHLRGRWIWRQEQEHRFHEG